MPLAYSAEQHIVRRGRPGVQAGLLGCIFGVLGIFTLGFVFVPLAALCSFVGLIRGVFSVSASGIGASLLAACLAVFGFATSPSLWAITAGTLIASNVPARTVRTVGPPVERGAGPTNEAQTQADQLIHLKQWTATLIAATAASNTDLPKFQPIEDKYRAVTEWMSAALARQRSIYADGQASVTRGQIGVAINQAGVTAEQLHVGFQSSGQGVATNIQQAGQAVVRFTTFCQSTEIHNDADLQTACSKFFDAASKFKLSVARFSQAFDHAENVWLEERQKQQGIIHASAIATR